MKQCLILGLVALRLLGPAAMAWGEGGAAPAPGLAPPTGGGLQAVITTSELVVGQNRLAFGLLKAHQLLDEADVVVRVYELRGQRAHLKGQTRAPYVRLEIVEQGKRVHIHPDGTRHVHNETTDVRGFYTTQVAFERPGPWGLEVLARQGDGPVAVSRFTVTVLAAPRTPAPGTPAPRSHNLIASDVQDLRQIDTSDPPIRGCIRSALRMRSRRASRRSLYSPRRSSVAAGLRACGGYRADAPPGIWRPGCLYTPGNLAGRRGTEVLPHGGGVEPADRAVDLRRRWAGDRPGQIRRADDSTRD